MALHAFPSLHMHVHSSLAIGLHRCADRRHVQGHSRIYINRSSMRVYTSTSRVTFSLSRIARVLSAARRRGNRSACPFARWRRKCHRECRQQQGAIDAQRHVRQQGGGQARTGGGICHSQSADHIELRFIEMIGGFTWSSNFPPTGICIQMKDSAVCVRVSAMKQQSKAPVLIFIRNRSLTPPCSLALMCDVFGSRG